MERFLTRRSEATEAAAGSMHQAAQAVHEAIDNIPEPDKDATMPALKPVETPDVSGNKCYRCNYTKEYT